LFKQLSIKPKLKNRIINIVSHALFIALLIAIIIILLLPPIFKKYKGHIDKIIFQEKNRNSYYIDLDYDGYSEEVAIFLWKNNSTIVSINSYNGTVIDDYYFEGIKDNSFDILHGDFNNNKHQEIYFFTVQNGNLLYINQLELFSDSSYVKKRIFVDSLNLVNKKIDSGILKIGLADLDQDGYKEVLFQILSGYSLQPRNVYSWNVQKDTLLKSPESYARNKYEILDFDNDGNLELIGISGQASGNVHKKINTPYHDHSAWLMILDNKLRFKYPPKEFKKYGSHYRFVTIKKEGKNYLMGIVNNIIKGNQYAYLVLYDDKLKEVKKKDVDLYHGRDAIYKIKINGENRYYLTDYPKKEILVIDNNFNILDKYKFSTSSLYDDIDGDKSDEVIVQDYTKNRIGIYRYDYTNPVYYPIVEDEKNHYFISTIRKNGNAAPQFACQVGNRLYLLNYYKNPYYWIKYPFYLFIYLFFASLFYLVQKTQKKRIEQKYAQERELVKLQIQTIKNQTDPHFIFNALNSISSAIYCEDKDTAYNFLNDFSSLIRAAIVNSDKIQITLKEEITFIENYLRLEKLRFKEKFDYKIDIDKHVDKNLNVPRMVLQSYIENAIKHGIMHADYKALLEIKIKYENNHLEIIIDDNGIGRENAKKYADFSTGKGLQIMNRIYELYDKLHQIKITQIIEDKIDKEGNGVGTRVRIEIPIVKE
jgi:hypothetical protein